MAKRGEEVVARLGLLRVRGELSEVSGEEEWAREAVAGLTLPARSTLNQLARPERAGARPAGSLHPHPLCSQPSHGQSPLLPVHALCDVQGACGEKAGERSKPAP